MKVLHVVASVNERTGGPAVSVTRGGEALAASGVSVSVASMDYPSLGQQLHGEQTRSTGITADWRARRMRGYSPQFKTLINREAAAHDIVHNHGLWMFPNQYARQAAVANAIPLVISPRGMLEPWSVKRSRAKKRLAWAWFEQENLKRAALFHATSHDEAESIRNAGFGQPIAVIPNGVEDPVRREAIPGDIIAGRFPAAAGKRRLLFLSRLHKKKGLDSLLHAWAALCKEHPEWVLVIAGGDLLGHRSELDTIVAHQGIEDRVVFTGELKGLDKASAFAFADAFALPSRSENFGIVIGEALSYGLPVLTTKATPWSDLDEHRCGWWTDDTQEAIHGALEAVLNTPAETLQAMGERGKDLIRRKYSWQQAGAQMAGAYRWLLRGADKPPCII